MADAPFVYLDWAATAPLSLEAARAMAPYLEAGTIGLVRGNGNANALHTAGRDAFKTLEAARRDIARTIDARPSEIILTSGATEADNAALIGIVEGVLAKRGVNIGYGSHANGKTLEAAPSVIISAIEHDAVLEAAEVLRRRGIEVLFVRPDKRGIITPEALAHVLDAATDPLLVSIMALNNETGALADIAQLAELAHRSGALFHSDATQAFGKMPLSVKRTGVDALSLSSHKIGGPKGVGALFLKTRTPFGAQIVGGGQEANLRSGTQNIAGVVGFAAAAQASHEQLEAASAHMRAPCATDSLLVSASFLASRRSSTPARLTTGRISLRCCARVSRVKRSSCSLIGGEYAYREDRRVRRAISSLRTCFLPWGSIVIARLAWCASRSDQPPQKKTSIMRYACFER